MTALKVRSLMGEGAPYEDANTGEIRSASFERVSRLRASSESA